ncbi:MAG TPA: prepilin-type N-terminal cleavage/methylation domain-containing protein [Myxococcaceae bacterium]|nr:prepilin-type N-terminal cleavage/methylation domain-containing protein [Myxococcaceae bacterium]
MNGRRPQNRRRHRPRAARRRGFTLIEAMVSMSILAVGLLGVLQMQVLASAQNGIARRTTQAAALLRDFQESARSIPWDDPRFAPGGGCSTLASLEAFDEDTVGNEVVPNALFQFTALHPSDPHAGSVGARTGALGVMDDARPYRGLAAQAFMPVSEGGAGLGSRGYQLAWNVVPVDTNGDGTCEARIIQFAVRFQVGQSDNWRSYVGQVMQYDPQVILPGGMFDAARMEAW